MKNFTLTLFFTLMAPLISYCQKQVIDAFTQSAVLIQYTNGASGSGLLVADSNALYIVTAKHVIGEMSSKTNAFNLVGADAYIISYSNNAFSSTKDSMRIDLVSLYNTGMVRTHKQQDIAVIKIANVLSNKVNADFSYSPTYKYLPGVAKIKSTPGMSGMFRDLTAKFNEVDAGDDAYMFGYPKSLKLEGQSDYDYDRPLLRKGIIAGIDVNYKTIIVDCPSYQGNSGGPLFVISEDKKKIGVIGIVSRSVIQVEYLTNSYYKYNNVNISNSGYTVIIPIEFAFELMK